MDYTEREITLAMKAHNCTREEAISTYCEMVRSYRSNEATDRQKVQYKFERANGYPSIADQLDMLWHSMDSGEIPKSTAFYNAISAIKTQYPKPTA